MFIGTYEHTIDDKSRLTLPARFREALGDGVVLARGIDGNGAVYPRETWKVTVEDRMSALDPLSGEARQLRRFFFAGAGEADIDGSGRVLVPAWLVEHAGLERVVVVAGNYDHLELWNPTTWEKHVTAVEGSVEHAAERLAAHGS
ncbi:division/cell wall cluster transcriptional repressor MraZ [Gaiella sp.]|jgi:MraZ protein|uniref:division/cell wall cluster transcriptional repressor MraZ n=1 Tax=Gaiella sp. TaxID=2663207 RepID=UPI002E2F9105|nr:division/cell wall cluster transcriptional repressor MraZ [Gaiella sp.]HEX5582897.1 division/cell wall cluster transcriptional repressor MraZ [Gaiella sp.]